jgi:hypothetical protein
VTSVNVEGTDVFGGGGRSEVAEIRRSLGCPMFASMKNAGLYLTQPVAKRERKIPLKQWKSQFTKCRPCRAYATCVLMAFLAGSLIMDRPTLVNTVRADSNKVFELRIYHAVPGKLPVMESRFRDKTSRILTRHNLNVVGYWVTEDAPDDSFVFLFAHQSREEAKRNWDAFRIDPEFQEIVKSEQAEKTLEKAEIIWLRPTDFSPMK